MIRLTSTSHKLQIVLAGAVATNQLAVVASYADKTSTDYAGGTKLSQTNGVTAVDIVDPPIASTIRDVDYVAVFNKDTANRIVTIQEFDGVNTREIVKATLKPGEQLYYTHGSGWQALTVDGELKGFGQKGDTGATGATGPAGPAGPAGPPTVLQDEGSPVAGAPHTTMNFVGAGVTVTDAGSGVATVTIPGGGGGSTPRITWQADQFDNPNNADWPVNALAPIAAGSVNNAIMQRRFDDTINEGVGGLLTIPTGVTQITFRFKSRAQTAPAGARTVGLRFYKRTIPDNSAVSAWTSLVLTDIDIPTNTNWQYDSQVVTLATLGLTAGNLVQFELVRQAPAAGTNLTGDWNLAEMAMEFS